MVSLSRADWKQPLDSAAESHQLPNDRFEQRKAKAKRSRKVDSGMDRKVAPFADVFLAMFMCFISLQAVSSCILFVGGKQPRFDQL